MLNSEFRESKVNKLFAIISAVTLPLIVSACSTTPSMVNPMLQHSESSKVLGDTWSEGNEQFEEGTELIAQGKDQIERGEKNLKEGLALVQQGTAKMKASEVGFDKLLNKQPIQASPESGMQTQGIE